MGRVLVVSGILIQFAYAMTAPLHAAETLDRVRKDGVLRVGVKADYPPFGYIRNGKFLGIEVDMARALAEELKTRLEFDSVSASTRNEKLLSRKIDLFIATMSDTPARREVIGAIEPNYYAAGIGLIAKNDTVRSWNDIKGQATCGVTGAFYNSRISEEYGARIVEYESVHLAALALLENDCFAFVYDDTNLRYYLENPNSDEPRWQEYELPVESLNLTPWAIAVHPEDLDAPFGALVSAFVCRLHKTGNLLDMEASYGLTKSKFLLRMNRRYQAKNCLQR